MTRTEDERIEGMVQACLEAVDAEEDRFTAWEVDFIESLEAAVEDGHLSQRQVDKLAEIYAEKVQQ